MPFFCEFFTNKLASIDPRTMAIHEYALPEGVRPRRLAINAADRIYYSDFEKGHLGRLDPTSGESKLWNSPGARNQIPMASSLRPTVWFGIANRV